MAPIDDPFVQLDRAEANRDLRLEERGAEQGAHNLPPTDTRTFDNVEADIVAHISDHHQRAQIDAANQLRTYDERLAQLTLLGELSSIKGEARTAVSDFDAKVANWRNQLTTRRDAIAESFVELREFKKENSLRRPAHSATRVATWGTLALAWLVESTINSFLLRQNDDMGLVGGFGAAAAIASINVGVSYIAGRLIWPLMKHPRLLPRVSGQASTILWVIFLLAWNLLAAHYRDAKTAGIPSPENEALNLLITQPVGLDSIYSWGLLMAGIIGAVVAAIAAYQMDDPYPGYGSISRRHDMRCQEYADDVEDATEELKEIRDEAIEQAGKVRSELGRQLRERDRVLAARQSFCRRYEENNVQLEQTGNALLETYRAANRRSRTETAPAHFAQPWKLNRLPLPEPHAPPALQSDLRSAEEALEEAIMQVAERFDSAIQSFESLEALKHRLSDGAS